MGDIHHILVKKFDINWNYFVVNLRCNCFWWFNSPFFCVCRNCVSIYCTIKWWTKERMRGLNSMKNFPQSGKPYWHRFRLWNKPPKILSGTSFKFFNSGRVKSLNILPENMSGSSLFAFWIVVFCFWSWFYYCFTGCDNLFILWRSKVNGLFKIWKSF